jgi:hypothetical protein
MLLCLPKGDTLRKIAHGIFGHSEALLWVWVRCFPIIGRTPVYPEARPCCKPLRESLMRKRLLCPQQVSERHSEANLGESERGARGAVP